MINLDQARDLLLRAVATQGRDFVYNPGGGGTCRYEPEPRFGGPQSKTGCLIGVALDLAGETRHHGSGAAVTGLVINYPDMMTVAATEYFQVAQTAQDHGTTWGQAFDRAEAQTILIVRRHAHDQR